MTNLLNDVAVPMLIENNYGIDNYLLPSWLIPPVDLNALDRKVISKTLHHISDEEPIKQAA